MLAGADASGRTPLNFVGSANAFARPSCARLRASSRHTSFVCEDVSDGLIVVVGTS